MPTIVTKDSYPAICAAFQEIEYDNGGHHVGTTHPSGQDAAGNSLYVPLDLEHFKVPDEYAYLLNTAEAGLARLKAESEEDFVTVMSGEETEQQAIIARQGDLAEAWSLLGAFFEGGWTV